MKKITFLLFAMLAFCWQSNSQVNINENFDSGTPDGWTDNYTNSSAGACSGNSERKNLWSAGTSMGHLTTPNFEGISNGTDLIISFDYKIVEYNFSNPTVPQAEGWGSSEIRYSTDDGANWITAFTIDDTNHVVSADCANISVTVPGESLPIGSDIKLQVYNTWITGDYYFYVDNFVAQQDLGCAEAEITSSTVVDDCENSQFSIDVVVASVGDGTFITDGLGGSFVVEEGTVTVGPYAYDTSVTLTVEHSVAACNFSLNEFNTGCTLPGEICENAIVVGTLPFTTTDNTENYGDDYSSTDDPCGSSSYLNGDDVVYSFTPAVDMSVNISTADTSNWVGLFVFEECPFVTCVGYDTSGSGANPSLPEVSLTGGTTYYIVISTYPSPQSTPYTLNITENSCSSAIATYNVVSDCDVSGGFYIDVDVTDIGSATALTVSDDQGNASQSLTEAGVLQFGPYDNGVEVVITIDADNDDDSCTVTSSAITQTACPPANDECEGAVVLNVENDIDDLALASQIAGSIADATESDVVSDCVGTANDDVWFSFVATSTDVNIDVTDDFDGVVELFSGECGSLVSMACDDFGGPSSNPSISQTDLVVGETYYVRVYYYFTGTTSTPDFTIALWSPSPSMSIDEFDNGAAFTYYPNPVKNTLTLNAQNPIEHVAMYNMLGQEVLRATPNTVDSNLDLSDLQTGTYFVKVTIGNITETVRVIKQ
ncbi:putative secreted protein (Por secretion system target) [Winogradskyella epiphytica]|uniref:Putative secreted protein (Por secretion system target) n=1 Tax=Winogradskyella epiphytica TaxID=262005 RepID=A0A2V4YDA7_9FLAO|nr:T9SS type A sorting domain-containing protein [Winogradskyella epiphytica]PYE81467.1 putative secreted protein (Por secretion system target) [Winogradskyella epiphytica]GGW64954.1 T9SS C-terminal target domain-containing protein [Winogradskyella epiphytica]